MFKCGSSFENVGLQILLMPINLYPVYRNCWSPGLVNFPDVTAVSVIMLPPSETFI